MFLLYCSDQIVWDGHFVSVPAQMVQRLFRAAPVAWRNEQNYTLRRTSRGDQRFIISLHLFDIARVGSKVLALDVMEKATLPL